MTKHMGKLSLQHLKQLAAVTADDFVGRVVIVAKYNHRDERWGKGPVRINKRSAEAIARAVKNIAEKLAERM